MSQVERLYADPKLARLYDAFFTWERRPERDFYLSRVMAAERVLDVGCGTGELLHLARERGHTGRLVGLDPAEAMLEQARRRADIDWVLSDLATAQLGEEFDLVVMTGHAFQALVDDDDLLTSLAAIRALLADDGRFVFETRNPAARAWEQWTTDNPVDVVATDGTPLQFTRDVRLVEGDVVAETVTMTSPHWDRPESSQIVLRFLDAGALASFLSGAGLEVEEQFGDWDGQSLTEQSPEIITTARRAPGPASG